MGLVEELQQAALTNGHARRCQLCQAMEGMEPAMELEVRELVVGRMIGTRKASDILKRNGWDVGDRAIKRHIAEGHS